MSGGGWLRLLASHASSARIRFGGDAPRSGARTMDSPHNGWNQSNGSAHLRRNVLFDSIESSLAKILRAWLLGRLLTSLPASSAAFPLASKPASRPLCFFCMSDDNPSNF